MTESTSLSSLLGVADDKEVSVKKESKHISLDYLTTLVDVVGPKAAVEIAINHTVEDIISMEKKYDGFRFSSQPKTAEGKMKRVLKFMDWKRDFPDVTAMSYYMENITESFSGFETLVQKLMAPDNSEVRTFNPFIRDQLFGVTGQLIESYGVTPTVENKKTGHVARTVHHQPKKVIPGITTNELLDFIIEAKKEGEYASERGIIAGFDDARTALQVGMFVEQPSEARLYVRNGFTSAEQVSSVSLKKLARLNDVFDFSGRLDSATFHSKKLGEWVSHYINGDVDRLDIMLQIGENGGSGYLEAFDGSVEKTQQVLRMSDEERPSVASIAYTRNNLGITGNQTIGVAREIDSVHTDVFENGFKSKEDFLTFKADYEGLLADFTEKVTDDDKFDYGTVKRFKGDLSFFNTFDMHEANEAEKVSSAMSYEQFKNLNVANKSFGIPKLLALGYAVDDIVEAFSGPQEVNAYSVAMEVEKLPSNLSLYQAVQLIQKPHSVSEVSAMLNAVSFEEHGMPFGLIDSLYANDIEPIQFGVFVDSVGMENYKSADKPEPKFDVMSFITDLKQFYSMTDHPVIQE